ncbi:MAG: hypothetical protein Q4D05_07540 [Acinetobacter sp.]|nr:hypothetical protein [Acinetobacter sp.]
MRLLRLPLLLGSMILFTACATTGTRQPISFDQIGHFSSYPLNAQSYRVSYKAPSSMSYSMAEEVALIKAAQAALKQGYPFFKVLQDPSNQQATPRQAVVYPQPLYYPHGYRTSLWDDPFFNRPQIVQIDPTEVSYTIQLFKEQAQANDAFDARLILQNLGAKYGVAVPTP